MNHPPQEVLLIHAIGIADATSRGEVADHIASCPECAAEVDRLRAALLAVRSGGTSVADRTPECLEDETVAALADGTLESSARQVALAHLGRCAACRTAVASVARALTDPDVERAARASRLGREWRWARLGVPVAAAALLLVVLWPRGTDDGAPGHRGPDVETRAAPAARAPVGPVAAARTLQWTSVAVADRYRVTLYDAEGHVLYEAQVADTVAALPDSVRLVPRRPYLWKVEARTGLDRWSASELVEFTLLEGGSP